MSTNQLTVGQQRAEPVDDGTDALQQFHDRGRPGVIGADVEPAMTGPGALHIQRKGGRQCQHSQRICRRRAVDDDAIPAPARGELADLVQPEHFLDPRQCREFLGGNAAQLGFGKPPIQGLDHLMPSVLEQRQGVQRQRVEKSAVWLGLPGIEVGEHPHRFTPAARWDRDAQHVAQRVGLVGGHHQHPMALARITDGGRGRQGGFSYPAFADEKTDSGRGGRRDVTGFTQPSTRFLRSFNAVSVNLRSALRLSNPIIGTARSTESS